MVSYCGRNNNERVKTKHHLPAIYIYPKISNMQTILRITALAAGILLAVFSSAQSTFFPDELLVSASALNLRDQPDKSGKVLEKLPRGAALRFIETVNEGQYVEVYSMYGIWLKVQSQTQTGFVFSPHVMGAYNLYLEGDYSMESLPPLQWYGLYMRDSFSDEIRPIQVRLEQVYHELFGAELNVLRTNQPEPAKFIIGSIYPLRPGFAGSLGLYDPGTIYRNADLAPGAMLPIYPGQEPDDTSATVTWYLAATGCAKFGESDFVNISDYQLFAMEMQYDGAATKQDLSHWVQTEAGLNPSVSLLWYGDLDGDRKPDMVLQDAPEEMGARISLFLSSKALPGAFLHKVCQYLLPVD